MFPFITIGRRVIFYVEKSIQYPNLNLEQKAIYKSGKHIFM